jgi:hypothetical protein
MLAIAIRKAFGRVFNRSRNELGRRFVEALAKRGARGGFFYKRYAK